jgi:hypothetical protein
MATEVALSVGAVAALGVGGYFLYRAFEYTPGQDPNQGFSVDDNFDLGCREPRCCSNGNRWSLKANRCMPYTSGGCDEGNVWVKDKGCRRWDTVNCKDPATYFNPNYGGCVPINQTPGLNPDDERTRGDGASTLYQNYNRYLDEVEQGAVDEFGCFDSQYTSRSSGGAEVSVKICGDAQSCWHEMIKGRFADPDAVDDEELGEWGQKVNAGLATCGVLGGAQDGTITFMNARQISEFYDKNVRNQDLTQEDFKNMDYAEWGQQFNWDSFIEGRTVFDGEAMAEKPIVPPSYPFPTAAPPVGWQNPAKCAGSTDMTRRQWDEVLPETTRNQYLAKNPIEVQQGVGQCINFFLPYSAN